MRRTENSDKPDLYFSYDAMGNRIAKKSVLKDANGNESGQVSVTYYFREASGNVMSVYTQNSTREFSPKEYHIYGSDRMGMFIPSEILEDKLITPVDVIPAEAGISSSDGRIFLGDNYLGQKQYELKDHLGNVHLVITDRKSTENQDQENSYDNAIAGYEYYPFGMALQTFESEAYRYGFNGMEKDDDWNGSGNSYDFGARVYDSRLGRFFSVDPMTEKFAQLSPYLFAI